MQVLYYWYYNKDLPHTGWTLVSKYSPGKETLDHTKSLGSQVGECMPVIPD